MLFGLTKSDQKMVDISMPFLSKPGVLFGWSEMVKDRSHMIESVLNGFGNIKAMKKHLSLLKSIKYCPRYDDSCFG